MPKTPRLTLCAIVRNEERHLRRCLESVKHLVGEIVLADTGSTDRTVEIARSFGARVYDLAWPNDFSVARNFSLERATGEWILVLDADESIAACDHAVIEACLRRADINSVTASQRHYLVSGSVVGWQAGDGGYDEGKAYPGYFDVTCRRLFRNLPYLRFQKPVHEELGSTDPAHPLAEIHGKWVIHHYGKADDRARLRRKAETYLEIGLKKVEERTGDPLANYELGIQYRELDRPAEAIRWFEKALALSPGFRDAALQVAMCCVQVKRFDQALASLAEARRSLPNCGPEIAVVEGNVHWHRHDLDGAERCFKLALAANPAFAPASLNLARLHRVRQRLRDGLACLDVALTLNPAHADCRALRAQLRYELDDEAGAFADIEQLGSRDEGGRLRARILARRGRFAEAGAILDSLSDPTHHETLALRGAVALGLGRADEAARALGSSMEAEPSLDAAMNLAAVLGARGDLPGALNAVAEALRISPDALAAVERFEQLAGNRLAAPSTPTGGRPLTVFLYQQGSIPYDGRTPRARGLGGTESAVVYLAEALTRRGHRLVVLNGCEEPWTHEGVEYARWETMPARCLADRPDVLVSVRGWQRVAKVRFAPLQLFWTGDAFDQPFVADLAASVAPSRVDFVVLQSGWQAQTFREHCGIPGWRTLRTRLGTAASAVEPPIRPAAGRRGRRVAYTSTPYRGLDVLLDVFPRIRAACPDAELEVFSSMQVYGFSEARDAGDFRAMYEKARQPGVHLIGSLPQPELARRLAASRILAYPNHFAETFCVAAAEAQAAGCVVVTTDLGALPETVGDGGVCLPGAPRSAKYQDAFVRTCVSLLTDDERWHALSERALERSWTLYAWPAIAEGWEELLRAALAPEPPLVERIARHLSAGRAGLAQRIMQKEGRPEAMAAETWEALSALAAWKAGSQPLPSVESLRLLALRAPSVRGLLPDGA